MIYGHIKSLSPPNLQVVALLQVPDYLRTIEAANDSYVTSQDCDSSLRFSVEALREMQRLGLSEEIVSVVMRNGAREFADYQTTLHFLSSKQVDAVRKRFRSAWCDSYKRLVIARSTITGRIIGFSYDAHPKTSARKARSLAIRGRRFS